MSRRRSQTCCCYPRTYMSQSGMGAYRGSGLCGSVEAQPPVRDSLAIRFTAARLPLIRTPADVVIVVFDTFPLYRYLCDFQTVDENLPFPSSNKIKWVLRLVCLPLPSSPSLTDEAIVFMGTGVGQRSLYLVVEGAADECRWKARLSKNSPWIVRPPHSPPTTPP
jgi:hypothetical protein